MINLIPKEEKKRLRKDFYFRLIGLFFVMIDICILVAMIGILPSYVAASMKQAVVDSKLGAQKTEEIPLLDQQTLSMITDINAKLKVIENAEKSKFSVSQKIINPILANKRADIKITQISYGDDPVMGKKVDVEGIAPSREVLLLFSQTLRNDPNFKNIDLPISNFVKGSNIQFSLSLIPA
jgi:hypothetical protein